MTPIHPESPPVSRSRAPDLALRRIAVLTEMDQWSASTRYRALQHLPRLRSVFGTVDVSTAGDTLARPPGGIGQIRYFTRHAARYARRGLTVRKMVSSHDALLVQRGLYPLGPATIAQTIAHYDGRVVFDLDDALLVPRPAIEHKGRAARWLYGPQQQRLLLRRADAIVVSSAALAEMIPAGTPAPVVLPTVPDPARYPIARHDDERPAVVGWAGTIGGLRYLDSISPGLERLCREGLIEVEVVSSEPWRAWSTFRRWRLDDETTLFLDFTIGIMPLPDTPYTRAKAGFKLLQYMAAGLPVVASPVGVNSELVRDSGAGFLADGPDEWAQALRELACSADLRARMGESGRRFVERYADLDVQAATLANLLSP
jgi:glycosyltransferase involved in cell wall biosynthesis